MTEHNIFQELQDDFERQRMDLLWKKYGVWVAVVALAAIVITAAWSTYQGWASRQQQGMTALYMAAAKPDADADKNIARLQKFADEHPGTAEADFALLNAAGQVAIQKDTAKAVTLYDAVAHDAKADTAFRQLGDLLSVQAQMDSGDEVALSARLDPLTDEKSTWRYSALEEQGYLALRAGDKDKAVKIFTTLSQDARAPQSIRDRTSDILRGLD